MGILARSVDDLKLFSHAIDLFKGRPLPQKKPVNQCEFAFVKTDQFDLEASDDLKAVWEQAKKELVATGAMVDVLDLGPKYEGWMGPDGRFTQMCRAEAGVNMQREYVIGKDQMGKDLPAWCENDITPETLLCARDDLAILRPDFDRIVGQYDAIITPTLPDVAPDVSSGGRRYFNSIWTGLHMPTVHVPGFAGADGMPMGMTLVGARFKDQDLLEVAQVVAGVWIGADGGDMKRVPAPEGVVHVRP
jgi:amidase